MLGIKIKGIKDLQRRLSSMEKNIERIKGEKEVPLSHILTPSFMQRYTAFKNFEEMLDESPFSIKNEEDFKKVSDEEWDVYVRDKTKFSSWKEMIEKAGAGYVSKKIFNRW